MNEQTIRDRRAENDLRQARNYPQGIIVTGTKSGNIDITVIENGYRVKSLNTGETLTEGAKRIVKPFLAAQYVVNYIG